MPIIAEAKTEVPDLGKARRFDGILEILSVFDC